MIISQLVILLILSCKVIRDCSEIKYPYLAKVFSSLFSDFLESEPKLDLSVVQMNSQESPHSANTQL